MNKELIKNIIRFEFNYLRRSTKLIIYQILLSGAAFLFIGTCDELDVLIMSLVGSLIMEFYLLSQTGIIPALPYRNQSLSSNTGFSWNYLHSVNQERSSFILALMLSGLLYSLPLYFCILFSFPAKFGGSIPLLLFVLYSFLIYAFIIFNVRLYLLYQAIHHPRVLGLHRSNSLKSWLINKCRTTHQVFHALLILFIPIFSFVTAFKYHHNAIIFPILLCSLYTFLMIRFILKIWSNEKESIWSCRKFFKKTCLYLFIFICIVFINPALYKSDFDVSSLSSLKQLINKNDINKLIVDDLPLIHHTILKGSDQALKLLIENKVDINKMNSKKYRKNNKRFLSGMSPLMFAIFHRKNKMAKILIDNRANMEFQNKHGLSALSLSSMICNLDMIKYLIDSGANINISSIEGSALHYTASKKSCLGAILLLKKYQIDESILDSKQRSYKDILKKMNPKLNAELEFYQRHL